ncbi:MAG TPA: hypothetical protein PKD90_05370 [Phnomibacter sp.]|nr:hypothetical protein [Phnomibacter sp.]
MLLLLSAAKLQAQYVQPERTKQPTIHYPAVAFDSLQAKTALALGKGKITGVAFTKTRTQFGYKAPLGSKIKAYKMLVMLFPVTPYLQEFLDLRDKKENLKKQVYVYMSNDAYRYRLEAITNSEGEFTFPDMKPGRYFLTAVLNYNTTHNTSTYTGSGYTNYGGQIDYYKHGTYTKGHSERLEKFVEVKADGEVVEVKLN